MSRYPEIPKMRFADALLKDMHERQEAGQSYSILEISDYTGLSPSGIQEIERRALKKIRGFFEKHDIPDRV